MFLLFSFRFPIFSIGGMFHVLLQFYFYNLYCMGFLLIIW